MSCKKMGRTMYRTSSVEEVKYHQLQLAVPKSVFSYAMTIMDKEDCHSEHWAELTLCVSGRGVRVVAVACACVGVRLYMCNVCMIVCACVCVLYKCVWSASGSVTRANWSSTGSEWRRVMAFQMTVYVDTYVSHGNVCHG